jgi:hypothetical protein
MAISIVSCSDQFSITYDFHVLLQNWRESSPKSGYDENLGMEPGVKRRTMGKHGRL